VTYRTFRIKIVQCQYISIQFIENKDYINNNIKNINICNLIVYGDVSIIYNESHICSGITTPCLDYIQKMYQENLLYYGIYITSYDNTYIIFNYNYHRKILLIDITSLNIIEFKSINECIEKVNEITENNYNYQVLRIIKRP